MKNKPQIIIFDSNYIAYRHKFSMPQLSFNEKQTHIIFKFIGDIITLCEQFETKHIVFAWDSKYSLRKDLYPGYKDKRHDLEDKTDDELREDNLAFLQFDELRNEVLPELGFRNIMYQEGYESDDTIAKFVLHYSDKYDIIVVASDKDLYQLLDHCTLCSPIKKGKKNIWQIYSKEDFVKKWEIEPVEWGEVKSRGGCRSDKVVGIPGVAEKKCCDYLNYSMNPKTVTFRKILMLSPGFKERNGKLVILPFEGTKLFEYQKDFLSIEKFMKICEKYYFRSYMNDEVVQKWADIFLTPTLKR